MKNDESYYYKAWEVSKHRNARSMRSLGRLYFFKEDYDKSIECYELSLKINPLFATSWYTLACAYMKKNNWEKALYCFGRVIDIDDSQGEAWSNIAMLYSNLDKPKEAMICLEQALKKMRENWKIWENFCVLSLENKDFSRAIRAFNELIKLKQVSYLLKTGSSVKLMPKLFPKLLRYSLSRT